MATALRAFGRADLANLRRDPMLRLVPVVPVAFTAGIVGGLPELTEALQDRFAIDLTDHRPLIVSFALIPCTTLMLAALAGLHMVEEKDAGTLHALRVTPPSLSGLVAYRSGTVAAATLAYVATTLALSGPIETRLLPALLAAGLCAGLLSAMIMALLTLFSANKLEGIAHLKVIAMLVVPPPAVAWFVPAPTQYLFGVLPTYWPVKIYWAAIEDTPVWPYALIGTTYCASLLLLLLTTINRRFDAASPAG